MGIRYRFMILGLMMQLVMMQKAYDNLHGKLNGRTVGVENFAPIFCKTGVECSYGKIIGVVGSFGLSGSWIRTGAKFYREKRFIEGCMEVLWNISAQNSLQRIIYVDD